jgi:predicted metal-dependent HD superfamily phosphohydrolase
LSASGVPQDVATRVRDLVLVTEHTSVPRTPDEQVLVDIDLSILGASEERFAEYERQIREEYSYVPGPLFRLKRRAVLKSFLDRPTIYSTLVLRTQFEARARDNLARALGANPA